MRLGLTSANLPTWCRLLLHQVRHNSAGIFSSQLGMRSVGNALFRGVTVEDDALATSRRTAFRLVGNSKVTIASNFSFKCPAGVPLVVAGSLEESHASSIAMDDHPETLAILATSASAGCDACPSGTQLPESVAERGIVHGTKVSGTLADCKVPPGCPAGKHNPSGGRCESFSSCDKCVPCRAGKMQSGTGMDRCDECPLGTFCSSASTAVTPCEAGKYSDNPATPCELCAEGRYANFGGQAACKLCEKGRFCATTTSTTRCEQGSYCIAGSVASTPCPAGSYCPGPCARMSKCGMPPFAAPCLVSCCAVPRLATRRET